MDVRERGSWRWGRIAAPISLGSLEHGLGVDRRRLARHWEWVRQARAAGDRVVATARDEDGLQRLRELGAVALKLDVMNTASASGLAWQIDGYAFDQIALVAGVFSSRSTGLQTPTEAEFNTVMQTNVLGPMRVLPQQQDALAPGARLAIISSRMGSISLRSGSHGA